MRLPSLGTGGALYDLNGRKMPAQALYHSISVMDVSGLSKGVYILKTGNSKWNDVQKVVVR